MSATRVLIIRVGAMGDVLHALPAVTALRRWQPRCELDWVVDPRWAPLLVDETGRGPIVSRVLLAETRLWSRRPLSLGTRRSIAGLRRMLRERHYDMAVDVQGTLRSSVLGWFADAEHLAGFADPRERVAGFFYNPRLPRRGTHVVEQGAALLGESLGGVLEPTPPVLPTSAAANAWAANLVETTLKGERFVLLSPTAGWRAKQWPVESFATLARELRDAGFAVLVNAMDDADPIARAVAGASADAARVVVCGVRELIALTQCAASVVGGDSGPVHLAAAVGTPVVALFGPTDPARNGPWGFGPKRTLRDPGAMTTYKRSSELDLGLAKLSVDTVLDAVLTMARGRS